MVRFTNKEFNEILKIYDSIEVEVVKGNNGYMRPWNYRLFELMNFKFSDSQFKKLIDYTFEEPLQDERVLKLSILISDEDFPKRNISVKSYDYYLDNFTRAYSYLGDFEDISMEMLYFRSRMYDRWDDKKSYELEACTIKYVNRLSFTVEKHIKNIISYLSDYNFCYRGYNGACFFNDYLKELEGSIDLDIEEFKIEDNIEDYLWENH